MNGDDLFQGAGALTIVESGSGDGALGALQVQERDSVRFLVRVISVRKRLLDEDNLCEKFHVDCCRYAGLLDSDCPGETRIETTQRKALKKEEEHVIIEISSLTK